MWRVFAFVVDPQINNKQSGSTFRRKAVDNDDAGRIVEAYNNMNKFLAAFLDHVRISYTYTFYEYCVHYSSQLHNLTHRIPNGKCSFPG